MPQNVGLVGLDVAKRKVDACIRGLGLRLSVRSTAQGEAALITWLRTNEIGVAVMEASGGYEQRWAAALRGAGLEVRIVDPKRVRHFAKSAGRLGKNDPIDADTIAWFGETFPHLRSRPHDAKREVLDHIVTARAALNKQLNAITNQGEHDQPPVVAKAHAAIVKILRRQIARLEAAIAAAIAADPEAARRAAIVTSVPGVGPQSAAAIIAWLPELGRIDNKAAAALVGLAPYDDDSGEHKGRRYIKGGRKKLRTQLFMAVVAAATQHNPILMAFNQRLRARGKEGKVALIACLRKLIVILNTMLARDEAWNPARAPA